MNVIFETKDKSERLIHLSKERWNQHIRPLHPDIENPEELMKVLQNPDKIIRSDRDEFVRWYFLYNKQKKKYLKVSVKYLNGGVCYNCALYTQNMVKWN